MDRVAIGLPTATWSTVVRAFARRSGLPAPGLLLVVVRLRRLCAEGVYRGGLYRGIGRIHLDRGRHRHVGVACPRGPEPGYLLHSTLGHAARGSGGPISWACRCPAGPGLAGGSPAWPAGARAVLRADRPPARRRPWRCRAA